MEKPRCHYFGVCNGCTAQHISYELQAENKKKMLVRALNCSEVKVFTGEPYAYRNRMDFLFHNKGIGLRKKRSSEIVDVSECSIGNSRVNQLLTELRNFFKNVDAFDVKKQIGTFIYAVIRAVGDDSSISIVLNEDSSRTTEAVEKVKQFAAKTTADHVVVTYVSKEAEDSISSTFFTVKGKNELQGTLLDKKFPAAHFYL